MTDQTLPDPGTRLTQPDGTPTVVWYQRLKIMWQAFNGLTVTQASDVTDLQASIDALTAAVAGLPALQSAVTALQVAVTALQGLSGSVAYDPPNLIDTAGTTTTVTVTGAALGNFAEASFSLDLEGIMLTAWVSAANTVSVRLQNEAGAGPIDLGPGTLTARVTT